VELSIGLDWKRDETRRGENKTEWQDKEERKKKQKKRETRHEIAHPIQMVLFIHFASLQHDHHRATTCTHVDYTTCTCIQARFYTIIKLNNRNYMIANMLL